MKAMGGWRVVSKNLTAHYYAQFQALSACGLERRTQEVALTQTRPAYFCHRCQARLDATEKANRQPELGL